MRFAVQAYLEIVGVGFLYSDLSDWSNWITTNSSTMVATVCLAPANGSNNLSPDSLLFRWASVTAGYGYRLQILCDSEVVVDWQRIADTAMTVAGTLDPGRHYSWRVQPMDENNVPIRWSAPWNFSTSPATSIRETGTPVGFELQAELSHPLQPGNDNSL